MVRRPLPSDEKPPASTDEAALPESEKEPLAPAAVRVVPDKAAAPPPSEDDDEQEGDEALGEEDFEALVKILSVLAAAGIFTSIVAVWYERWDARLAAALISDVRASLFDHVQNLPAGYFARTRRGEILSRFSVDLSAFEGAVKSFANSAALPFFELIAGIILMLFLNWQLAAISLLVFPITLIGPRILTPKAVQANYEQKLNESALLGMVQEN